MTESGLTPSRCPGRSGSPDGGHFNGPVAMPATRPPTRPPTRLSPVRPATGDAGVLQESPGIGWQRVRRGQAEIAPEQHHESRDRLRRSPITPAASVIIGREGDLVIDDNPIPPSVHRGVDHRRTVLWPTSATASTLADGGRMQSWLGPGPAPSCSPRRSCFTAGPRATVATSPSTNRRSPRRPSAVTGGDTIGHPAHADPTPPIVLAGPPSGRYRRRCPRRRGRARRLGWARRSSKARQCLRATV